MQAALNPPESNPMATHELPWTYKIARPAEVTNIGWDVIDIMWEHVNFYDELADYRRSIEPATKGQLAIYACTWYMSEVSNGGHDQFFFNSTGMVWQDALDGFALLGAEKHRAILAEAVAVFPNGKPSFARGVRCHQLESADTSSFDALDSRLYGIDEDLDALFARYIDQHPDDFFTDP
jgi:hypothetical protein